MIERNGGIEPGLTLDNYNMIEEGMIDGYDEETGDYHVVDLLVVD